MKLDEFKQTFINNWIHFYRDYDMSIEQEHAIMKAALIRIAKLYGTSGIEYDINYGKYRAKNGDRWDEGPIGRHFFANELAKKALEELK